MIDEHVSEWLGLPVELYDPSKTPDYAGRIYRIATNWDQGMSFAEQFKKFTANPACGATKGIVAGAFHGDDPGRGSEEVVQLLVAARQLLPNLRGIFVGDVVGEENEISWIIQSEMTPLFEAYPALEHFRVRGSGGLGIGGGIRHAALQSLVFESGGLPAGLMGEIAASEVPALVDLEIWTGSDNYGGDSTVADLRPFLDGSAWPWLRRLGLRDCEYADSLAEALIGAPMLARIQELDLSLGNLGDRGGEALLKNPALVQLQKLDLHHHYFSEGMVKKLAQKFPQADLSDAQGEADDDDRYIAVSE
ncbi:MAG: hypothetical protein QOE70_3266 [Chthoniobacter sp.]|jgi:hypothetical protein|nr:hypothetical protein [Chthoniobacter sp.]